MAAVNVTIIGVLTHADGTTENVTLEGAASLTGLGVGGGPIIPPDKPPDVGPPGKPTFPIYLPPGSWPGGPGWKPPSAGGGYPPSAEHPIVIPPDLPPGVTPPTPPNPGDPTTPLPPPAGQAGWPVQPIVVPPYIIVNYPGVGPVVVAPPASAAK